MCRGGYEKMVGEQKKNGKKTLWDDKQESDRAGGVSLDLGSADGIIPCQTVNNVEGAGLICTLNHCWYSFVSSTYTHPMSGWDLWDLSSKRDQVWPQRLCPIDSEEAEASRDRKTRWRISPLQGLSSAQTSKGFCGLTWLGCEAEVIVVLHGTLNWCLS